MQERTKLTILAIFCTLVMAWIIENFFLAALSQLFVDKLYHPTGSTISFTPYLASQWYALLISIIIGYLIVRKIDIDNLVSFLKPNIINVGFVVVTQLIFISIAGLGQAGIIPMSNTLVGYLTLRMFMYGELFPFANPILTIIIYYFLGCLIYLMVSRRSTFK